MANTVALEFAGDAAKLAKAGKDANKTVSDFGQAAKAASDDVAKAGKESDDYLSKTAKLGAGLEGMSGAVDDAGASVQALADIQSAGVEKAQRLARAANDVAQAQEDMAQATRDAKQAQIDSAQAGVDLEQAQLDQSTALKDYNAAVKEHGKNSDEARQAQIDLKQAGIDVKQAQEDSAQAIRDGEQATIDAKGATLDLAEAQREANPPDLQVWADQVNMVTPLLTGLMGVVGLVTAAQWAWNAAQLASPVTWIVLGIVALIAIVVLLVKNWDTVKKAGAAAWDWIKDAASNTWNFIKKIPDWIGSAFGKIAKFITAPFRLAFNFVADAWNNTVGRLSWSVPGWVPGIGGNSISVPHIPRFHTGGKVPGPIGQEQMAILTGGEEVSRPGAAGGGEFVIRSGGSALDDLLVEILAAAIGRRGGNVQAVLGSTR
jgi:hypothetical protein